MEAEITRNVLMYFVLPLWLAAGFADWLCHRASSIETTSGPKESLLHLLLFAEMGVPILAALFLEINALIIAVMIVCFVLHEATSLWDVSYASKLREITPIEQHVHSFLEMLPLMALLMIVVLHWTQFLALFGLGTEPARFDLTLKRDPLPWPYIAAVLVAVLLFELLPFVEELVRGLRAKRARNPASR
jgi:ABC-type proline/glycine betaine transport system permease subunit